MRKLSLAALVSLLLGTLGFLLAPAQAITGPPCQGQGTNYTGSIIVPAGTTCNLQGGTITGSVYVQPGGRLISGSGTHITGSVYSNQAGSDTGNPLGTGPMTFSVLICNTIIDNSLSVNNSTDHVIVGDDACGSNRIGASATFTGNQQGVVFDNDPTNCPITNCFVGGSVMVNNNTGLTPDHPFTAEVANNVIRGSLSCSGNTNGVTDHNNPNTATAKSGQCAAL